MPALTIAAACRYALTGVGAAIAPGSQKWKGKMADLLSAPTSSRTIAVASSPSLPGRRAAASLTIAVMLFVP